jgi:hypothetical protein
MYVMPNVISMLMEPPLASILLLFSAAVVSNGTASSLGEAATSARVD